jgi:hypothetical protein
MEKFLLSEMYRLEIHWEKTNYEREGLCKLSGAYFSGPALKLADKVNAKDHMYLDFYKQYYVLARNVYVAKFSWNDITYDNNIIKLHSARLSHDTEINTVPKLRNNDCLVVDTKNHDSSTHAFFPTYETFVINEDGILYKF